MDDNLTAWNTLCKSMGVKMEPTEKELELERRISMENAVSGAVKAVLYGVPAEAEDKKEYLDQVIGRLIDVFDPEFEFDDPFIA